VPLTIASLYADLARRLAELRRDPALVRASRRIVDEALASGQTCYGINTGFGALANQRIPPEQLTLLQRNLLLSHAVGVGPPVPRDITALMLRLKVHALGLGFSGVSPTTFERLLHFDELGLVPVVPSRGSVGASGDLAPLAHLCLPLIGFGEFWDANGIRPAAEVLADHNLEPIELAAKDGLALINGTQLMSGYGAWVLEKCQFLVQLADLVAAMSLEALQGSIKPFDRACSRSAAPRSVGRRRQRAGSAGRERDSGVAPPLRQGARPVLPPLCAAGPRGLPRRAGSRRQRGRNRD